MILLSISRSIKFALESFWRNVWLSLATIFIIYLALLSVNFLILINALSDSAVGAVKERVDVSVYFKQGVKNDKITEIKTHLESMPQVKNIAYRSPEDNYELFSQRHQDDLIISETLKELEGNPLGATLIIKANNLSDYPEILSAIDNPAYVRLIEEKSYQDHEAVIEKINTITDNVKKGALFVSLLFGIISVLIVYNTVRIAIFTHQSEVGIMKLVGASNWFIRSPFIIESVISGIIACVLSLFTIFFILSASSPYLQSFFAGTDFNLMGFFIANLPIIFITEMTAIILINIISSVIALNKYLNI